MVISDKNATAVGGLMVFAAGVFLGLLIGGSIVLEFIPCTNPTP